MFALHTRSIDTRVKCAAWVSGGVAYGVLQATHVNAGVVLVSEYVKIFRLASRAGTNQLVFSLFGM